MSEAMIEARNVVKTFDGFQALDGLTMTVPHGSIYGLVRRNRWWPPPRRRWQPEPRG